MYKVIDNKAWYCISIFYSRGGWLNLLKEILSYYHNNNNLLHCCLIYFSEYKGEHIRVTYSSNLHNTKILQNKISDHFQVFLKQQPSENSNNISYGKVLWGSHTNNTLLWNGYEIQHTESEMSQNITFLMPYLLDDDISIENVFSVAMFLSLKLFKSINIDKRLEVLNTLWGKCTLYFGNMITKLPNDMQNDSLLDAISNYWELEYDDDQSILLFNTWMSSAQIVMLSFPTYLGYSRIVGIICEHLGLNASYSLIIVNSIKLWYESSTTVLDLQK